MNKPLSQALQKIRLYQQKGDTKAAIQQCRKIIRRFPKSSEPYVLLAQLHHSLGHMALVLDALAAASQKTPSNLSLKLDYGDMCMQAGEYVRAAKIYKEGLSRQPTQIVWSIRLAAALQETAQTIGDAITIYKNLIAQYPNESTVYYNLGTALKHQHKFDETITAYRQAVKCAPNDIQYRVSLCNLFYEMTRFNEAVVEGESLLDIKTDLPEILGILYYCHKKLGNYKKSLHFAEKLTSMTGPTAESLSALASAQIAVKQYSQAIDTCDIALEKTPTNRRILADKSIALSLSKNTQAAQQIFDINALLNVTQISVSETYQNIDSFNQAIIAHVESHPTIRFDGLNHTCLGGVTSDEIFVDPLGPIQQLRTKIVEAVNQYRHSLLCDESHPWLANLPAQKQLNLSGWVTRLRAQGYQQGHIHPTAWISGVYYVHVPMANIDNPDAGGIEFGHTPSYYPEGDQGSTQIIRPIGGTLVLFPSYFYHRTIPFDTDAERFTLAFDFRKKDFS